MYYTHEYSDEKFEILEECEEDLRRCIDWEELADNLEIGLGDVILKFCERKNNDNFINWFEDKIFEAEERIVEGLIFLHEEDTALDE